ncbi:MAG: hypothetical protein U0V70_16975 [Terriglobia bacterium]
MFIFFFTSRASAQSLDSKSRIQIYSSTESADKLDRSGSAAQQLKLSDGKDYELSSKVLSRSINGGDQIEREVSEVGKKLSPSQFQVERQVRIPDANGKLFTSTVMTENHTNSEKKEEIQRSYYQADMNGKMSAQSVENETHTQISANEKEVIRATYRPGMDGKMVLLDVEEGTEKKIADNLTVKESTRKGRDSNGQLILLGTTKETITRMSDTAFKKETALQQISDTGRLVLTDKIIETQSESKDGTKKYQRLLESRNITPQQRNLNGTGLILAQRVTGEERRLPDGSFESQTQIETIDPLNQSNGLRVSEIVSETSKPIGSGKVSVERIIKVRDVNGNFIVAQKVSQIIQSAK